MPVKNMTVKNKKPTLKKAKFGSLKNKLLKQHPGELKNNEAEMLRRYINNDPAFAAAYRNSTPSGKPKR